MTEDASSRFPTGVLPDGAQPPQLLVCERTGWWAAHVRQHLGPVAPRVREVRTLAECAAMLARSPASFALVELSAAGFDRLLAWLPRLERDYPLARVAVVAERSLWGHEVLLREAGAVHFTCSARQLGPLVQAARVHLASVPGPRRGLADRIWAALPWGSDT